MNLEKVSFLGAFTLNNSVLVSPTVTLKIVQ